jgi:hypothetical protein
VLQEGLEICCGARAGSSYPPFVTPPSPYRTFHPPPRMGRVKGGLCSFQPWPLQSYDVTLAMASCSTGTSLVRHNHVIVEAQMEVLKWSSCVAACLRPWSRWRRRSLESLLEAIGFGQLSLGRGRVSDCAER